MSHAPFDNLPDVLAGEDALAQALALVEKASNPEALRVQWLGRKGTLTLALRDIKQLPPAKRAAEGKRLNQIRQALEQGFAAQKNTKAAASRAAALKQTTRAALDASLPPLPHPAIHGRIHPLSHLFDEVLEIFASLGFDVAFGPEIETQTYNFTALNIPAWHPARDMHDSFYLNRSDKTGASFLLRTHTSPVQIRVMERTNPPVRMIAPGRVYRRDSDRTHTPMFHQIEGLVIEDGIHIGHLLGCLRQFLALCFAAEDVMLRVRPSYFPFTEPSIEVDAGFVMLKNNRTKLAAKDDKNIEWLEMGGAGMVHPHVLQHMGVDSKQWQGFAFGLGLDRLASLKYGLPDLRRFFAGDLRWLAQHGRAPLDFASLAAGMEA